MASPNWAGNNVNVNGNSVIAALTGQWQVVYYKLTGPIDLTNAIVTFVLNFDSSFVADPNGFQFFDSKNVPSWTGDFVCWNNGGPENLVVDVDTTVTCSALKQGVTGADEVQVGLQFGQGSGTVTIKSATIQLAQ